MVGLKKQQPEKKKKETIKNFMSPFYGWFSTASKLESLWGDSLLYNTEFPETFDTHFINQESALDPPNGFEYRTPGLGI